MLEGRDGAEVGVGDGEREVLVQAQFGENVLGKVGNTGGAGTQLFTDRHFGIAKQLVELVRVKFLENCFKIEKI